MEAAAEAGGISLTDGLRQNSLCSLKKRICLLLIPNKGLYQPRASLGASE